MTEAARPQESRCVVRVLTPTVVGERLLLRGHVEERPPVDDACAPSELVFRERASGEELRVGITRDGAGPGVAGEIDAGDLLNGRQPAVWHVRAAWSSPADVPESDVVADLDANRVRPVMLHRDDQLHRATPDTTATGQLVVVVDQVRPHAEVERVLVEEDAIVLDAFLSRVPVPPAGTAASLVATSRERPREVSAPASLDGVRLRSRIPLQAFDTDLPVTEYWDLHVRIDGGGTLRVAGFLDGVVDKKRARVFPAGELRLPQGSRSVRPYFTVKNGLSVRSEPVQPGAPATPVATPAQETGRDPRIERLQRVGIHLSRRLAFRVARTVVRSPTRRTVPPTGRGRPRISILVMHGYGMGGTIRTVYNQAAYLSREHDVEILSQIREREQPFFPLPPGVTLTPLDDRTDAGRRTWPLRLLRDRLARVPSLLVHEADSSFARCSLWTDVELVRRLRMQRGGILMATRPSLNLIAARLAHPECITVGQEHLQYRNHRKALLEALPDAYRHLDALVALTEADLQNWSRSLAGSGTRVVRIPNSRTPLKGGLADPSARVVVSVGRLTGPKGFDLAIRAFGQAVREHPGWSLHLYGSGPQNQRLRQLVFDLGLYNEVLLMGRTERVGEDLARASVFVMSSRSEGLPMVLIEAMSKGLAVVSTDCGGPREIIDPGKDGLLVPNGDVDALARALRDLMASEDERRRLGVAALSKAAEYDADVVGRGWDELFARLLADRSPSWWRR